MSTSGDEPTGGGTAPGGAGSETAAVATVAEPSRPDRATVHALVALTFVAGAVDAVTFLALSQVFAAIMTGNLLILGFGIADAPSVDIAGPSVALGAFVLGAVAYGRIGDDPGRHVLLRRLATAEAAAAGIAALILIGYEGGEEVRRLGAITMLAGVMGFRNATIRQIAIPELRTTVMTFSLAGLAVDEGTGKGFRPSDRMRAAGVIAIVAGAAISALILLNFEPSLALALVVAVELGTLALLARAGPDRAGDGAD